MEVQFSGKCASGAMPAAQLRALVAAFLAAASLAAAAVVPAAADAGERRDRSEPSERFVRPVEVRVGQQTATTARVRWRDRSRERFFQLKVWPGGKPQRVRRDKTSTTVTGLEPAQRYRVAVRACKRLGNCTRYSFRRPLLTDGLPVSPPGPGGPPIPGQPPIPGGPPPLGFNEPLIGAGTGNELMPAMGASFVRIPLQWNTVEHHPGRPDFSEVDRIAAELARNGLRPFWVVTSAPCWAQGENDCLHREAGQAPHPYFHPYYARFVTQVAKRYPQTIGIQIWNEPNIPKFWSPTPNTTQYRHLVQTTITWMRNENLRTPIVFGGLSPVDAAEEANEPPKIATLRFMREVLTGGLPGLGAVAVHPYGFEFRTEGVAKSLEQYDDADRVVRQTVPGKPIWVTETGFTTAGTWAITPREQAASLSAVYEGLVERGADLITIHKFYDDPTSPFGFEAGMGVVRRNRATIKPAYCTLATLRGKSPTICEGRTPAGEPTARAARPQPAAG